MPETKKPEDMEFSDVDFDDVEIEITEEDLKPKIEDEDEEDVALEEEDNDDDEGADSKDDVKGEEDTDLEEDDDDTDKEKTDTDYKPDHKYKVNGVEFEFDDDIKAIVTNKEVEDKIRNLYAKADGIEKVQESRDRHKQKVEEVETNYRQLKEFADETYLKSMALYENGHKLEALLNLFKPEDIIHSYEEIQRYQEMDDRNKRLYDSNFNRTLQDFSVQKPDPQSQLNNELIKKNTDLEMDMAINYDTEVNNIAKWLDSKYGDGTFKKKVYNHAALSYDNAVRQRKQPLTTKEYVKQVAKEFSEYFQMSKSQNQGSNNQEKSQKATDVKIKKKIGSQKDRIPVVKSKGSALGKPKFSDLKPEDQTFDKAREYLNEDLED